MKQKYLLTIGLVLAGVVIAGIWQLARLQDNIDAVTKRVTPLFQTLPQTQKTVTVSSVNPQVAVDLEEMGEAVRVLSEQVGRLTARLDNSIVSGEDAQSHQYERIQPPRPLSSQEKIVLLESFLNDAEISDEIWSTATTVKIDELVYSAPEYKVAESMNVECGGRLCKIDASLPAGASQAEKDLFEVKLILDLAEDLPRANMAKTIDPDGSTKYHFYFARKGYLLPTEGDGTVLESASIQDGRESR